MSADNDDELEPTIFSAVITPHRSLSARGFFLVMGAYGLLSFVAGLTCMLAGAWPVIGFLGLDVLLLYWAFKVNYRHAAAYEEVKVTPIALTVRKVSHLGTYANGCSTRSGCGWKRWCTRNSASSACSSPRVAST